MPNKNGIITRKDIIEDEALNWGGKYAELMKSANAENEQFAKNIILISKGLKDVKNAQNNSEFLKAKQEENLLTLEAINNIKKQEAAEISMNKIKVSGIATMEAERKAKQAVTDAENKAQKVKEAGVKLTIEERIQQQIANKELKQEALERLGLVSAYTKLNNARSEAKNKLRDLIASESASTKEIEKAKNAFESLDAKVRKADKAVGDFTKNVGNYPFGNITSGIKNLIGAFGITTGITAFVGIMKGAYETTKKFEQGVADLSAITGASGKDLAFLKNSAIDMGKGVKGGAIAVVEAYKLIASAKPELLSNVAALNQVTEATIRLSQASGLDLPEAATKLTDAMNQFAAPASEASKYVDVLASGAKYGAAEIPQLTDAILEFGAVAKVSNIGIKESVALVELLAEKGLKGAQAGTAIKNILLEVNSGFTTKEARAELDKYGISWQTLKDKTIPFSDKLELLKPLLADTNSIVNTFKKENSAAAISLIENTTRLKELTSQVGEFGVAEEQAGIRMDTLNGKTEILSSTYDSLVLSIGKGSGGLSSFFKGIIEGLTNGLKLLIRFNTSWDELFLKAKIDGEKIGKKQFEFFSNGKSKEEIVKEFGEKKDILLKEQDRLLKELKKRYKEKKDLDNSVFSSKVANQDVEKLQGQFSQLNGFINAYNEAIKTTVKKQDNTNTTPTGGETDAERKKREAAEKKAREEQLAKEKALADALYELRKQRLEQTIKFNEEIVTDDTQSDDMRIKALENSQDKQQALLLLNREHLLDNDKLTADDRTRIQEDYENKSIELNKKTQKELDKINEFDFAKYQSEIDSKVKAEQTKENDLVTAENEAFKKILDNKQLSHRQIEKATQSHEERLFQIKKDATIAVAKLQADNLEVELNAFKLQSDGSEKSTKLITDLELKLSDARKKLAEAGVETFTKGEKDKAKSAKEQLEEINKISQDLLGGLSNLSSAFSQRKIQELDDELQKNNEYYDKQIELAGKDERKKELLAKERDKKNAELEKKKRAEQHKQAVLDKAITIAKIGLETSLALIKAAAATAPTFWGVAIAATLGAISLAAAIATPIPKYKDGRIGGKKEIAMINDGGVTEVVERPDGTAQMYSGKNRIVQLFEGDTVHRSLEDYQRMQRASMMASIDMQGRKLSDFQAKQIFESNNDKLLEEMKLTRKAIEKNKTAVNISIPKIDLNHELWKMKNNNWNQ